MPLARVWSADHHRSCPGTIFSDDGDTAELAVTSCRSSILEMYRLTILPKSPTSARCARMTSRRSTSMRMRAIGRRAPAIGCELEKQSAHFAHYRLESIGARTGQPGKRSRVASSGTDRFLDRSRRHRRRPTREEQSDGSGWKDIDLKKARSKADPSTKYAAAASGVPPQAGSNGLAGPTPAMMH